MTTDILFFVGGPTDDNRADLRWAIRSLAANLRQPFRHLWVVGDPPGWLSDDVRKLPLKPHHDKFRNQTASVAAYVHHPDAATHVILTHDDIYLTEPTAKLPTCRCAERATGWLAAQQREGRSLNRWHKVVMATAEWVTEQTGTDPWMYETHTPLRFHTRRLADALDLYPADRPLAVTGLYPLAGSGGVGRARGNAKVKLGDDLAAKIALDMPFLSSSPPTWNGELGQVIGGMFPDKCRFER